MLNIDKIKKPLFLENPNYDINSKANRQEYLYWFHSPNFSIQICHIVILLQAIWILDIFSELYSPNTYEYYLYLSLSITVTCINLIFLVPAILYYLTINNNVLLFFFLGKFLIYFNLL